MLRPQGGGARLDGLPRQGGGFSNVSFRKLDLAEMGEQADMRQRPVERRDLLPPAAR
jgi:hypothetical protein